MVFSVRKLEWLGYECDGQTEFELCTQCELCILQQSLCILIMNVLNVILVQTKEDGNIK